MTLESCDVCDTTNITSSVVGIKHKLESNNKPSLADCIRHIVESTMTLYIKSYINSMSVMLPGISLTVFGFLDNGMHTSSFSVHAATTVSGTENVQTYKIDVTFPRKRENRDCAELTFDGMEPQIMNNIDVMSMILNVYIHKIINESENICVTLSCPYDEHSYSTDAFKRLQECFMEWCRHHLRDVVKPKKPTVRLDQCDARYTSELNKGQTVSFICHPPLVPRYYQLIGTCTESHEASCSCNPTLDESTLSV